MPLPQDIRPAFQDIQDTLVRSDAPWVQQSPLSSVKVLWVGRETGTWASLHHWKKGYVAPPHKHLAGALAFIISGKLQVRNGVLNAGDYVYEPSGILHNATTALEDTTYLSSATARCCSSTRTASTAIRIGKSWKNCALKPRRRCGRKRPNSRLLGLAARARPATPTGRTRGRRPQRRGHRQTAPRPPIWRH